VLSDFSLDEIITNPVDNVYKKHLLLLMIFPDIPVLRSLDTVDFAAAEADRNVLLRPTDYLSSTFSTRTLAMVGAPEALRGLQSDIANKHSRIQADVASSLAIQYVPKGQRVNFGTAVAALVQTRSLNPAQSAADFFELCKLLFQLDVSRLIDRPSSDRKGPSRLLNQQIDYYHLSYLPFVDAFVTDDNVLRQMASELRTTFLPSRKIHTVESYRSAWNRRQLMK
jgi:hypothetical protein